MKKKTLLNTFSILIKILIVIIAILAFVLVYAYNHKSNSDEENLENLENALNEMAEESHPNGYSSLEEYYDSHQIELTDFQNYIQSSGGNLSISGNDVIIEYEMKGHGNFTKEYVQSDKFKNAMDKAFAEAEENTREEIETLSKNSKIENIRYVYRYYYDKELVLEHIVARE